MNPLRIPALNECTGCRALDRRGFLISLGGALMLGGCGMLGRQVTHRYKMTLVVDTPSGEKRGSAVREIVHREASKLPSPVETRSTWDLDGEAVAIDVAPGRTLFALLAGGRGDPTYATWLMPWLVGSRLAETSAAPTAARFSLWPNPPASLLRETTSPLPMLAHLRDLTDPKSAEEVDPGNLAGTFGPDVSLREVQVGLTDEPVTRGIEDRLPWLRTMQPGTLSGGVAVLLRSPHLADRISTGEFIMRPKP